MPTLSLSFLGPPLVAVDGEEVKLPRRKSLALLAYLAVTARPHSRDSLAELLYPGHDRERAYSDLRQTLSALRAAIGEKWIEADRSDVALTRTAALSVDTEQFQRLLTECRASTDGDEGLRQAAVLVRGPFLAGFYLKDCPELEEWQAAETERLRREESYVLERLVARHEERGEHPEAIEWCRKLLVLDPLEEEVHRRLMLLYALWGKRAAALAQYAKCVAVLRKELDEAPSAETEELRERIASGKLKAAASRSSGSTTPESPARGAAALSSPFVGRAFEMGRLAAAMDGARRGAGRAIVVVGEAGIGKTRLLEEAVSRAADSDALVLWGRCYDDRGLPPYWPWRQILAELARRTDAGSLRKWLGSHAAPLAALVPEIRNLLGEPPPPPALGNPESERFRLSDAVSRLVRAASEDRPLVLVLDDIHWADDGSLRLLEFMARGLAGARLLILAACRDVESDRAHPVVRTLGELGRDRWFERIELGALSHDELALLAAGATPEHSAGGTVDTLWERTRGNPLFAVELLRSRGAPGSETPTAAVGGVPAGLRAVIRRRFEGLSRECFDLLSAAAVLGDDLSIELLAKVSGRTADGILPLTDEATTAGILTPVPDHQGSFRFNHPLVQECLTAELNGTRSAEAHVRIAAALEDLYGVDRERHAIEIAHHLGLARPLAPAATLSRYSLFAGEQALAGYDAEAAVRFFERGLEAKGPAADDAETAWLRFGLARALVPTPVGILYYARQGNDWADRAFAALAAAYEHLEQSGDVSSALRVAGHPLVLVSRSGERHTLFARALGLDSPGSAEHARLLYFRGLDELHRSPDYAASLPLFEQALAFARSRSDRAFELQVAADWSGFAAAYAPPAEGDRRMRTALELLSTTDDPSTEFRVRFRAYHLTLLECDLEASELHAESMYALAERMRSAYHLGTAFLVRLELGYVRGDWTAVRAASDAALSLGVDIPITRQHLGIRATMELEQGDTKAGERYTRLYVAALERVGLGFNQDTEIAIGLLAGLYRLTGELEPLALARAAADADCGPGAEDREQPAHGPHFHTYWNVALLVALEGDRPSAERLRSRSGRGRTNEIPGLGYTHARLLGLLDMTVEDAEAAVEHFGEALALYRPQGANPNVAWTCSELAEALIARGKPGDRRRAAELLAEGLGIAERLGMSPLAERIGGLSARAAQ